MQSEQAVRAKEVRQLHGDIRSLQEALAAEQARSSTYYNTLAQALANESTLRARTVHQCSEDLQGLSGRVAEIRQQLGVHDEQVTRLVADVQTEMRERQLLGKTLGQRCSDEARERGDQCDKLARDLEELTGRTEADAAFTKEALQRLAEVGIPPPTSTADWPPSSAYHRGRASHEARSVQLAAVTRPRSGAEAKAQDSTAAPATFPPAVTPSSARGSRPSMVPFLPEKGLKLPQWQLKHAGPLPFSFVT